MLNDRDGKPLEKGFYFDTQKGELIYFTGNYQLENFALAETSINKNHHFTSFATVHWARISDLSKFVAEMETNFKWAKKRQSELESKTKIADSEIGISLSDSSLGLLPYRSPPIFPGPERKY